MIRLIAGRELAALFKTPLAWLLLGASQLLLGWVFLEVLERYQGADATGLKLGINAALAERVDGATLLLLLLLAPLLGVRSLSQDLREGTDQLLASAPIGQLQLLLGKLAAVMVPLGLLALLPLPMMAGLFGAAPIDLGLFAAATFGLWLCALLFASVGLFTASLVRQPTLALVLAYALVVLLSLIQEGDRLAAIELSLLDWLAWPQHLIWLFNGVVRLSDLGYFLLLSGLFVALAQRQLDNRRLG
jgi:ABC-2 type transport system permease protein